MAASQTSSIMVVVYFAIATGEGMGWRRRAAETTIGCAAHFSLALRARCGGGEKPPCRANT
eukprot:6413097-Pyramimonas_sp.AAC.1